MSPMFALPAAHPKTFDRLMAYDACLRGSFAVLTPPKLALGQRNIDRSRAFAALGTVDNVSDPLVSSSYLHRGDSAISTHVSGYAW